jgi:hypothetical protein
MKESITAALLAVGVEPGIDWMLIVSPMAYDTEPATSIQVVEPSEIVQLSCPAVAPFLNKSKA